MALLNFWKNSRQDVLTLRIEQIVASAGDGLMRDGSTCSTELRAFLSECPADNLYAYAEQCLEKAFTNSGLVLQDVVNEFGSRLDFIVEAGLYRGKPSAIGFDGVWRASNQPELIIEAKTTDYVTLDLEKHAGYKRKLVSNGRCSPEASTLIVVGREDTGALEAQIRGSRYAWEMRLISVERLAKLVKIKQKADDASTVNQIRALLQPFEYTKIDRIIDVIFTTTQEVERQQEVEIQETQEMPEQSMNQGNGKQEFRQVRTNLELVNAKRAKAVAAFASSRDIELIQRSTTLYSTPNKKIRVCCAVSKRYTGDYQPYWYAFHPGGDEFLRDGFESYFILACMDRSDAFAIPYSWIVANKSNLNMTEKGDKSYWHVPVTTIDTGDLAINMSRIGVKQNLKIFQYELKP